MVRLDDAHDIARGLTAFLDRLDQGGQVMPGDAVVRGYERAAGAARLAALLDAVTAEKV